MRIAFATDNGKEINKHFGHAKTFEVYELSPAGYRAAKTVHVSKEGDDSDDKIQEKIDALLGSVIVYCTQIGGPAAARLVKNKIHPVKADTGQPIKEVLDRLQERLNNNSPVWLKRLV